VLHKKMATFREHPLSPGMLPPDVSRGSGDNAGGGRYSLPRYPLISRSRSRSAQARKYVHRSNDARPVYQNSGTRRR